MDLSGLTGNSPMFDMTTINLQNEMEILLSRRILSKVVDNLNLTTRSVYGENIMTIAKSNEKSAIHLSPSILKPKRSLSKNGIEREK
jgi:uncharacterized protein involved in exopolysaccharide biosynthesis